MRKAHRGSHRAHDPVSDMASHDQRRLDGTLFYPLRIPFGSCASILILFSLSFQLFPLPFQHHYNSLRLEVGVKG
ncbi:hypothetical protein TNCT_666441 [Trichonephila clavata]|uniref:Uncharacterized protein n=2 Tax=Trichonephila TaxID=2585208 RepID=A0A8X6GXE8_TRICU|nr:hypothetical protein TNCT_666441 [Trichonephila clavata]GFY40218.1 hypothetical protein TNIN_303601 [Trichonephila inaurata madagascariensis]